MVEREKNEPKFVSVRVVLRPIPRTKTVQFHNFNFVRMTKWRPILSSKVITLFRRFAKKWVPFPDFDLRGRRMVWGL